MFRAFETNQKKGYKMKKTTILNSLNTLICCCILLLISACSSGMSDCGVPEFDVDDSVNTTVESARDTIAVPAGAKEKKAVGAMK